MPIVATDWSINASKIIDYIGDDHGGASPSYASGIELHRWLSDLSDDSAFSGDDIIDRTKPVASKRSTDFILRLINGYTITAAAIEHLYDVSITQGTVGVDQIIYDPIVVQGNSAKVNIIQNAVKIADDFWNANGGLNPDVAKGITHRFLVKVHDFVADGGDIDGRRLHGTCRPWGGTWKYSFINGTERGKNYMFLDTETDINNDTLRATVGAYVGISNSTEGYNEVIDANGNGTPEPYFSSWTYGANGVKHLYERAKYLTDDDAAGTMYGLDVHVFRGITHSFAVDGQGVTDFAAVEQLSWTGGTGQLLAVDDVNAASKMWIQLLTGDAPANNDTITGATSGATCLVNGAVSTFTPKTPFIGQYTGTGLLGGLGEGVSSVLSTSDSLTDLNSNPISPPNIPSFTAAGLEIGDGSVTLYPWDGVSLDSEGNRLPHVTQMTLAVALTGASETTVDVGAGNIPATLPDSGKLRITTDGGVNRLINYSAHNGDGQFTIASTDFSVDNANIGNGLWIAFIDEVPGATTSSFNYPHNGDVECVIEVRDPVNQIVPYIAPVTLGAVSQTVTAIRNNDF